MYYPVGLNSQFSRFFTFYIILALLENAMGGVGYVLGAAIHDK